MAARAVLHNQQSFRSIVPLNLRNLNKKKVQSIMKGIVHKKKKNSCASGLTLTGKIEIENTPYKELNFN